MPQLGMITTDTTDALGLSAWWADLLNGTVVEQNDGYFCVVQAPNFLVRLAFQLVEAPTAGKNRMHLDLVPTAEEGGREEVVKKFLAAGATRVDQQIMGDFAWDVLADPQGNVFCVSDPH